MLNLPDPPQRFGIEVPTSLLFRADGVPVSTAHFRFWHSLDMADLADDVRFRGNCVAKLENLTSPKISRKSIFVSLCRRNGPRGHVDDLAAVAASATLPSTNASLSDASNAPDLMMFREFTTSGTFRAWPSCR